MSVTAAQGFEASGVSAGIRPSGRPDVAVVRSVPAAVGAALWTTNRVQAAPVTVSKRHLSLAEPQAVLINAGVANAATGAQGEEDAVASAVGLAEALGLEPEQVLVLSTGVIGARLPLDKVLAGAQAAAGELSAEGGDAAAGAILTTDSGPKVAVRRSGGFTVGGMAKGAGMIHPRLATMLVVITTDYPLAEGEAEDVPAARRRAELQPDLRRRGLLDERRRDPARQRGQRRRSRRRCLRGGARRGVRRSCPPGRG